jgi:stage II sporulation protein D
VRRTNGEPLRSTLFDVTLKKAQGRIVQVVFDGHGWGHGVGLCQVGAMERARRGQSCEAILKHYYRGIHLTRLYDAGPRAARP